MKTGINLKQFRKFIEKQIGKKCKSPIAYDCLICDAWDLYEHLEAFLDYLDMLKKSDVLPPPKGENHK